MSISFEKGTLVDGRFLVTRELGRGGMGVVLAARDQKLDRDVALKLMLVDGFDPSFVARFLREARIAASLQSEHTVRVFHSGELEDGSPYIVMELLEGVDLETLLRQRGAGLPVKDAVDYVLQACEALSEAHSSTVPIVHRDLKPANLFLKRSKFGREQIKILDFGIAKVLQERNTGDGALTQANQALGTPLYMSPEQRLGRHVDVRADIWALGSIIYELLTFRPPFYAETRALLDQKALHDAPDDPKKFRSDLPGDLVACILRCIEKDPADRFRNVSELAMRLVPFGSRHAAGLAEKVAERLDITLPIPAAPAVPGTTVSGEAATAVHVPMTTLLVSTGTKDDLAHALLSRAKDGRPVTFLVGSGLSLHSVPGVDGILKMVEAVLPSDQRPALAAVIARDWQNRYPNAFRYLFQAGGGAPVANRIVRQAVLSAIRDPGAAPRSALDGDEKACRALQDDHWLWTLTDGVAALGKLVARFSNVFGETALTSNFDPLIEVAIARAGGKHHVSMLARDGSLSATEGPGCHVVHFHGGWYRTATLHTPRQLEEPRPMLEESLRALLKKRTLVVLAYGGWDDVFTRTLVEVADSDDADVNVLWAFFSDDEKVIAKENATLLSRVRKLVAAEKIQFYRDIDAHKFLPHLLERLEKETGLGTTPGPITIPPRPDPQRRYHRYVLPVAALAALTGGAYFSRQPPAPTQLVRVSVDGGCPEPLRSGRISAIVGKQIDEEEIDEDCTVTLHFESKPQRPFVLRLANAPFKLLKEEEHYTLDSRKTLEVPLEWTKFTQPLKLNTKSGCCPANIDTDTLLRIDKLNVSTPINSACEGALELSSEHLGSSQSISLVSPVLKLANGTSPVSLSGKPQAVEVEHPPITMAVKLSGARCDSMDGQLTLRAKVGESSFLSSEVAKCGAAFSIPYDVFCKHPQLTLEVVSTAYATAAESPQAMVLGESEIELKVRKKTSRECFNSAGFGCPCPAVASATCKTAKEWLR